jgi:hypothetical protein
VGGCVCVCVGGGGFGLRWSIIDGGGGRLKFPFLSLPSPSSKGKTTHNRPRPTRPNPTQPQPQPQFPQKAPQNATKKTHLALLHPHPEHGPRLPICRQAGLRWRQARHSVLQAVVEEVVKGFDVWRHHLSVPLHRPRWGEGPAAEGLGVRQGAGVGGVRVGGGGLWLLVVGGGGGGGWWGCGPGRLPLLAAAAAAAAHRPCLTWRRARGRLLLTAVCVCVCVCDGSGSVERLVEGEGFWKCIDRSMDGIHGRGRPIDRTPAPMPPACKYNSWPGHPSACDGGVMDGMGWDGY